MEITGLHHNPYDIHRITGAGEPASAERARNTKSVPPTTTSSDLQPASGKDKVTLNHATATLEVIPETPSEVLSEEEIEMLNRVFPSENSGNSLGGYGNQNSNATKGGFITQLV